MHGTPGTVDHVLFIGGAGRCAGSIFHGPVGIVQVPSQGEHSSKSPDRSSGKGKLEVRSCLKSVGEHGKVAEEYIERIEARFDNVHIEEFVVMPNHVHGIIMIG